MIDKMRRLCGLSVGFGLVEPESMEIVSAASKYCSKHMRGLSRLAAGNYDYDYELDPCPRLSHPFIPVVEMP